MNRVLTLPLVLLTLTAQAQTYSLSPVFGNAGAVRQEIVTGADVLNAHVLLPDGKLLVTGYGYDIGINSYHVSLMRLDTVCGVPDPTFGNGGVIAQTHQQRTVCQDMTVQPDGRIVGVGMIAPSNAGSQQKAGIFRFMPDGSVDSTFNGTGYHQALWDPISSGSLWRAFVNDTGAITCVGESRGNINGGVYAMGAMRFTADGQFDPSFSGDGIATVPIGASQGTGVMRPDGRVLAVGETFVNPDQYLSLAQFMPDGSLDTTFGNGGYVISPVMINSSNDEGGMGASLLPDGRLLVSTTSPGDPSGFLMARFHTDGSPDSTFGVNGVSIVTLANYINGYDHELLADGSTLQFGTDNSLAMVLKRDPDGQVVTSFGTDGFVQAYTGVGGEGFRGGFTLPSGRIIGYGGANTAALVMRLTTDPGSEHFVDLGPDVAACEGEAVVLDAGAGGSYVWNDASTSQTLVVVAGGTYSVVVTDANGCVDQDAIEVVLFPLPPPPVILAAGLELSTTAIGDLQWILDGTPIAGATASAYTATENGSYTVSVTDANGCTSTSDPVEVIGVNLAEMDGQPSFQLHPVPVSDRMSITGITLDAGSGVTAIDAAGGRHALTLIDGSTMDTRSLATGSYILEVRSSQRTLHLRFVRY